MPYRLPTPCKYPGCPNTTTERFCPEHQLDADPLMQPCREQGCPAMVPVAGPDSGYCRNHRRPSAAQRGYGKEWRRYRDRYIRQHPYCVECGKPAQVVDHIRSIKQGGSMWNPGNHQQLCKRCHDKKTAKEDGAFGNKKRTRREPRP